VVQGREIDPFTFGAGPFDTFADVPIGD